MLTIGQGPARVSVDPPLILAPMAGVTDRDFRLIVRRIGGVGVVTMEFVSSKALVAGDPNARKLMAFSEEERPISIQIYGSDAATMAEAARIVEDLGADLCDINMGCPANKILKNCAGARLMGEIGLAEEIIREVRRAISIPLTVKFRLGIDDRSRNFVELGRRCQDLGVDAVALHGRTAKQMFRGKAEWEGIACLKRALSIPVLGNGDIREAGDALEMFEATGCDGVLIGRGATRNPWIFRQIQARLSGNKPGGAVTEPALADRRELILDHFRAVAEREESRFALHKLRLFTRWYSQGLPHGVILRRRIGELPDVPSFMAAIEEFFDLPEVQEAAC